MATNETGEMSELRRNLIAAAVPLKFQTLTDEMRGRRRSMLAAAAVPLNLDDLAASVAVGDADVIDEEDEDEEEDDDDDIMDEDEDDEYDDMDEEEDDSDLADEDDEDDDDSAIFNP